VKLKAETKAAGSAKAAAAGPTISLKSVKLLIFAFSEDDYDK